jgi:hypothetical protein
MEKYVSEKININHLELIPVLQEIRNDIKEIKADLKREKQK